MKGQPVERYGIKQADGECVVELYLKKLAIYPVPAKPFNFNGAAKQITISRVATVKELKNKILRVLNMQAYSAGNKAVTFQQCRLWSYVNNNMDEI